MTLNETYQRKKLKVIKKNNTIITNCKTDQSHISVVRILPKIMAEEFFQFFFLFFFFTLNIVLLNLKLRFDFVSGWFEKFETKSKVIQK